MWKEPVYPLALVCRQEDPTLRVKSAQSSPVCKSCLDIPSALLLPALSLRLPAASFRFSSRVRSRSRASLCLINSAAALRAFLFDLGCVPSSSESASSEPVFNVDGGLGDSEPVRWRLISCLELQAFRQLLVVCLGQLDSLFAVVSSTLSFAHCWCRLADIFCLFDNSTQRLFVVISLAAIHSRPPLAR